MDADCTIHPIPPAFGRQTRLAGLGGLAAAAAAAFVLLLHAPDDAAGRVSVALIGLFAAILGACCLYLAHSYGQMTVFARKDGIKVGTGDWIPWTAIKRVRERGILQRVDLLGNDDQRLASIEFQVEDASDLIDHVIRQTRRPLAAPPRRKFGKRFGMLFLVGNGLSLAFFVPLGVWLWLSERIWLGLLLPPVVVLALYADGGNLLREVEVGPTGLALRTALRERVLRREDIAGTELLLKPMGHAHILSVLVVLRDESTEWIHPVGTDAQEVHAAVTTWLGGRTSNV
jgi:hypothetical protein